MAVERLHSLLITFFVVLALLALDAFYLMYLADVVAGYTSDIIAIGPIAIIFGAIVGFSVSKFVFPKSTSITIRGSYILFCSLVTIVPTIFLYFAMGR